MPGETSTDDADAAFRATLTLNTTDEVGQRHSQLSRNSFCTCINNYRRYLYRFGVLFLLTILIVVLETAFPAHTGVVVSFLKSALSQVQNGTHGDCTT